MPTKIQHLKIRFYQIKERFFPTKKQPINQYSTEIPGRRPDLSALPPLPGQSGFPNQFSTEIPGKRVPVLDLMKDPRFQQMQQQTSMPPYMKPGAPASPAPAAQPVEEKPPHWIWNVPDVIGDHLDWIYSKLPANMRKRQKKRDDEQRYEQFVELANGRR